MEETNPELTVPPPQYNLSVEDSSKASTSDAHFSSELDSGLSKPKSSLKQIQFNEPDQPESMVLRETGDARSDVDDPDFEDETILERLIGLTEMFPDSLRNAVSRCFSVGFKGLKSTYSLSRTLTWFVASTATVCFLPLMLELERVQTEEQEAVHQRTMMLGPRAAGGGSTLAGFSAAVPHLTPMDSR